ncbi:hypothetical protein [Geodermatophilus chilensis]|jgi:hypothetical protein|uniref:hypothetical protein n=1 Tax=Geodermatophilus chilensis TaxID=2035835 RepID=UPI000C2679A0|nr:hypothetical protein [Geodermatophilus chilensis]
MGLGRKVRAAKEVLQSRAEAVAQSVEQHIDSGPYRGLRRGIETGATAVQSRAQQATDAALRRAAASEQATAMGAAVRRTAAELSSLPVLSLPGDTARAKNGVLDMRRLARQHPDDPLVTVQLAESLQRYEADMRTYRLVRGVAAPHTLAVSYTVKAGSTLGRTELPGRPSVNTARRGAQLAARRLRQQPGDRTALHALARAALVEGRLPEGLKFAAAAVKAGDSGEAELVTLARAQLAAGELGKARRGAQLAVQRGCSVGYEVLAQVELRERPDAPVREQLAAYERTLDRVSEGDYRAYYGVRRTGGSFARSLLAAQGVKTWQLTARVGRATAAAAVAGVKAAARPSRG